MPAIQTSDDVQIHYRDWGIGSPVVFVSAWALSGDQWQYQMAHMVNHGLRAICYDRRGHGRSDDPGHGFDYTTLADDLARLVSHLDLRDVTLVAHSMGGGEVVRYLTRHGIDRVARIALVAPTLPFPGDGVDPSLFEALRDVWRHDLAAWLDANAGPYFGDGLPGCSVSNGIRDWTLHDMLRTSLLAAIEFNRTGTSTDFRDELPGIGVPTLLIHGDTDASIPIERSSRLCLDLISGSRLTVYENAPHGLYLSHRDRLNTELLDFVKS
jgi:non-heme chloroperoxidase